MIKILTLGIFLTGLVWFVVSEDRVRSYIEWDLENQLKETVSREYLAKVDYKVAGQDVIIQQHREVDSQEMSLIREQIYSVPGVNRVLHVDGFKDEAVITQAIASLSGAKDKRLFARVQFSDESLTLTGNVAAPEATAELLVPLIDTAGLRVNNYLSFHDGIPPRRWLTFLHAFAQMQPLGTTGELLITDLGVSIVAEDQALVEKVPELLALEGVDLPVRVVNLNGENSEGSQSEGEVPMAVSQQMSAASIDDCNEELTSLISGNPIAFNYGSDGIEQTSVETLEVVARMLDRCDGLVLLVEGHTDNLGSEEYNRNLSQRRADAVRVQLLQSGVGGGANDFVIQAVGVGENRPIAPNNTREGRSQNRRIELKFLDSKTSEQSLGANTVIGSQNIYGTDSLENGTPITERQENLTAKEAGHSNGIQKSDIVSPTLEKESSVLIVEEQSAGFDSVSERSIPQQREIFFEERRVQ